MEKDNTIGSRRKAKSGARHNRYLNGDSLMIIAVVLIIIGLIIYYLSENIWVSGLFLAASAGLSVRLVWKRKGPFEFAVCSFSVISLVLFILCCSVESAHFKIEKALEYLFLNDWDWFALLVAVISLIFAACTWISQERTQKNTMRITPEIQLNLLKDIFRHSYRNMMVLYALEARLRERYDTHYPSEEHLQKMKMSDDVLYPESFIERPEMCSLIQNLKLNLRNRDIELDTATEHLKNPSMPPEIKAREMRMLKKGIEYTIKRTTKVMNQLYKGGMHHSDIAEYVHETAATRRYDHEHDPEFAGRMDEAFRLMDRGEFKPYYTDAESEFIKSLYPDKDADKIAEFLRYLNANIYAMETGDGEIWAIPFNKEGTPIVRSMYGKVIDETDN